MLRKIWLFLNKPLFSTKEVLEEAAEAAVEVVDPVVAARKAKKAERLLEKAMRKSLRDVVLQIQNGEIEMSSVFAKIEERLKGGSSDGGK